MLPVYRKVFAALEGRVLKLASASLIAAYTDVVLTAMSVAKSETETEAGSSGEVKWAAAAKA